MNYQNGIFIEILGKEKQKDRIVNELKIDILNKSSEEYWKEDNYSDIKFKKDIVIKYQCERRSYG